MPRPSIIDKLQKELQTEITSERQVVYVLVEIRKLIDSETDPNSYVTLKIYCDWAVHTELTKANRIRPIMSLVDNDIFECFDPNGHGSSVEDHEKLQALLYLDALRSDLLNFLRANNLPTAIADDDAQWFKFLNHYSGVIEDCSLIYKADDLRIVRQITFRKERNGLDASQWCPFNIIWEILLKDGRLLTWPMNPNRKLVGTRVFESSTRQSSHRRED